MTRFSLPTSWHIEKYDGHYSVAYHGPDGRDDYDFRVEFTDGAPEAEQSAVMDLIEHAPRLLVALDRLLAAIGAQTVRIDQGDMLGALEEAVTATRALRGRPA